MIKYINKGLVINRYKHLCMNKNILEITQKTITPFLNQSTGRPRCCFSSLCIYNFQNVIKYEINLLNSGLIQPKRYKYNRKTSKGPEYDSDSDDSDNDLPVDGNSKTVTVYLNSLRADAVIKSGLQISRNKVDTAFYENNIRVNGNKLSKKSERLNIGDEIDFIKGVSPMNSNFLHISRLEIVSAKARDDDEDGLAVKLRKFKTLYIEDYGQDPWKKNFES